MNAPRLIVITSTFALCTLLIGCAGCGRRHELWPRDTRPELFQIILNVRDIDAQVRFYRDILGCEVLYPKEISSFEDQSFVRLDAHGTLLALHSGRTTDVQPGEPRLSFMTTDIRIAWHILKSKNIPVSDIRSPAVGVQVIDARDPEGNVFHVEQHRHEPG